MAKKPKRRLKHDTSVEDYIKPTKIDPDLFYKSAEVAAALRTTRGSFAVRRFHNLINIPVHRCGGRLLFFGKDILDYLASVRDESGRARKYRARLRPEEKPEAAA